ncbi:hypothetical protein DJ010_18185 [Nocardioides silvaticus]|uniref:Lipoprotein n=1 Tax=Nocardioides silvaticus TaxID=2201891 RepID=A0A316TEG3_9ACTN|nr:DUF6174 domain-containing protein [Nocardioides silvaticus]PWN01479.1 hypothetical protein DJ010_18185 [Nocardioides silvaticus]
MKILLSAATTALALSVLAGCSGDDDDSPTANDPAGASSESESGSTTPSEEPTVGTYPEFAEPDYTYVLEQTCFCPLAGPVEITVEDGEVTSAVVLKGMRGGLKKGDDAPEYLWKTLNEVIDEANDTEAFKVDVAWPEGQDWPDSVSVDRMENAVDEEVYYTVHDVEVQ